jgi:hypothetical protein
MMNTNTVVALAIATFAVCIAIFIVWGSVNPPTSAVEASAFQESQGKVRDYSVGFGPMASLLVWNDPQQGVTCYIVRNAISCVKTGTTHDDH